MWASLLFGNKAFVRTDDPVSEGLVFLPPPLEVGSHPKNRHPGTRPSLQKYVIQVNLRELTATK